MNVKEAVQKAINYSSEVFASEGLEHVGLEEVEFNQSENTWDITIGFSRPWDRPSPTIANQLNPPLAKREYKLIQIDDKNQEVKAIKIRERQSA